MKGLFCCDADLERMKIDDGVEVVNKWLKKNEEALITGSASEDLRVEWRLHIQRLYDLEEEYIKLERENNGT